MFPGVGPVVRAEGRLRQRQGQTTMKPRTFEAVIFDHLTALLDSWTYWCRIAGTEEDGLRWRDAYLELTYAAGAYRAHEDVIFEATEKAGLESGYATRLITRWNDHKPWPEAPEVLSVLGQKVPLAIATNSSDSVTRGLLDSTGQVFTAVITAESTGFYKPRPEPYLAALKALECSPERALFVAGSAADVPGAKGVGMAVYWHNRRRLKPLDTGDAADFEATSLWPLLELF